MNWNGLAEFLAMSGYAIPVWSSLAITALALLAESLLLRKRLSRLKRGAKADE